MACHYSFMIYFIQSDTYIKIGYTASLESMLTRINNLQVGNPIKLNLIHAIAGSIQDEKILHKKFIKDYARGEWFYFSSDIKNFLLANPSLPLTTVPVQAVKRYFKPKKIKPLKVFATHCKRGHEWSKENTLIAVNGQKVCRLCRRLREKKYNILI